MMSLHAIILIEMR